MNRAWFGLWFGVLQLFCAATVIAFDDRVFFGFALGVIGILVMTVCAVVIAQPWLDPVDREIDAWERDWTATWSPECPVHRDQMCYVRTRNCPAARDRIDA